jgi:orotate phosphoribosyltransferase
MDLKEYQEQFIRHLVHTLAIRFGRFQLKSGRISPYFINIGLAMKDGEGASRVGGFYARAIMELFGDGFDYLYGPAYKGIPLAALIANHLWEKNGMNKRWGYDRKQAKTYGDKSESILVGDLREGDRVLIVDDVMTTGKTKADSWAVLASERPGVSARGIMIAVDRMELTPADSQLLKQSGLSFFSIVSVSDIFEYLRSEGAIDGDIFESFQTYIRDYGTSS